MHGSSAPAGGRKSASVAATMQFIVFVSGTASSASARPVMLPPDHSRRGVPT
jgi:hypothetical protein